LAICDTFLEKLERRGKNMQQEIYDARLQHYLKKIIAELPREKQDLVKSIRLCNSRIMPQPNVEPAVFLLRSDAHGGQAKFFGQMTCKNPWACPHCSSMMMVKYKEKIASALDALRDESRKGDERMFGFMITFTIPHLRFQSCREVTDILYNSYREMFRNAWNKKRTTADGKHRYFSPMNAFIVDNDITWYVRCAEYTWSQKNGWHPHFHVIFWMPRSRVKNFDVQKWQKKLNDAWATYVEREMIKYWKENNLYQSQDLESKAKCLLAYMDEEKKLCKNPAIKISVDKDGKLLEALSSDYLCGWGSDSELTGNYQKKASHKDHLTPYQILEKAADGDLKMKNLYLEYLFQVTRKPVHHRVDLKAGLMKIISAWRQTEGYKSAMKKKQGEPTMWELVCWFSKSQWYRLSDENLSSPVLSNIMYLAAINRKDLLESYLQVFEITLIERPHFFGNHVENIFNNRTKEDLAVA